MAFKPPSGGGTFTGGTVPNATDFESVATFDAGADLATNTFLTTEDKDTNAINLIGYLSEIILIGDFEFGNETLVGSGVIDGTDQYFMFAGFGSESYAYEVQLNDVTDPENPTQIEKMKYESTRSGTEWKFEKDVGTLPLGYTYNYFTNVLGVTNGDILQTFVYGGLDAGLSNSDYFKTIIDAPDITLGAHSGRMTHEVAIAGTLTKAQIIDSSGITNKLMVRFDAQSVTGGVAYASFETSLNSDTYAYQFGGGTTVPGAVAGWNGAAIFTDQDAVGVNRTWINIGTSSSADFRRISILSNAASYSVSGDSTDRTFDASTVGVTELANVVATLLKDLGIA